MFSFSGGGGEGLWTERKNPVETTKLRVGLYEGSGGRWSIKGGERNQYKTLTKRLTQSILKEVPGVH